MRRTIFAIGVVGGILVSGGSAQAGCGGGFHPFRGLFHRHRAHAAAGACGSAAAYSHAEYSHASYTAGCAGGNCQPAPVAPPSGLPTPQTAGGPESRQ